MIGRALRRREDVPLVRGEGRYVDDLALADLAHVVFVRSQDARARILGIRAPSSAPGLLRVLTAADLRGRAQPLPVGGPEGAELADEPHPILAGEEVRYAGQPVAAVVAESRAQAVDAAELVEVEYEALEAVVDPHAAPETLMRWERAAGDVDGLLAGARHRVRARHRIPRLVAAPIEPRGVMVAYDAEEDRFTFWVSAQDPHRPLSQLAHALMRSRESIRVVVPDVGGAFGSKGVIAVEAVAVAVAAMDLGRPLKWVEDRVENFLGAYQGRGIEGEVELGLDAAGRILALKASIQADLGAYLLPTTAIPPHTAAMLMTGCYDIPAAAVSVRGARTDKVPTGPYRGAGRPEAAYLLERTVDVAARRLGLDPVELRRRNLIRSFPHRSALGFTYDSGDYERCLDLAVELLGPAPNSGGIVGKGVAMYVERAGGQWESARISVRADGRVIAWSGSTPHGQGHETTFAQIVAGRLGVDIDDVEVRFGDTAEVPAGVGTFASRSVAMGGSALVRAAEEILEQREGVAAPGGLEAEVRFESEMVFGSGAYAAAVEIDRDTGRLTVVRLAAVDDAGTIINPLLAEGQVHGGIVQGLGAVLMEEAVHDADGQPRNASFVDYSVPGANEMPSITTAFVHSLSPHNPLGAKGIGEGGAIGTPAAIANAVADALGGDAPDPPFTAEKLWRALSGRGTWSQGRRA
ncbi:MAG TPA: xanthine dehydrogenase family protein molybdopterin-binding subunit [Solirubrobacteraceae bacterium]|nr:xanthine dehydrogenase family protein molybdopterin-binding subunit [Solirubrobacteraceae bacterium]